MIPKVIHYCWFGKQPLGDLAQRCILSWKKFFPNYTIMEWNEENFDISSYDFVRKAYEDQKWAFVSDVVRLIILYQHGGIYFDTDVEVISSFNDILANTHSGFIGFEKTNQVNSGLGLGAEAGHPFLKKLLDVYVRIDYDEYKDRLSDIACTVLTTQLMKKEGLKVKETVQNVCGFDVYPSDYFCPIDYCTGEMHKTSNTHSIHWYYASWKEPEEKETFEKLQKLNRIFGAKVAGVVWGIISCVKKEGLTEYIRKRAKKYIFRKI